MNTNEYELASDILQVDIPTIKAIIKVESKEQGFTPEGKPIILFERHIFYKYLLKAGYDVETLSTGNEDILSPRYGGYTTRTEYDRLRRAIMISGKYDPEIEKYALMSTSWGLFQIMGFNYASLGYESIDSFVRAMYRSEYEQLLAFIRFIQVNHLAKYLQARSWAEFAKRYNGPAYARNKYDQKLEYWYNYYSETKS